MAERASSFGAREWVGYLFTVSAYLQLPDADRAELPRTVSEALPDEVDVGAGRAGGIDDAGAATACQPGWAIVSR